MRATRTPRNRVPDTLKWMRKKKRLAAIREYMGSAPVGVAHRHYEFRGGGAILLYPLRRYARNRVGKMTREIVDKDLHGGYQSPAMRQQGGEGGFTGEPARQHSGQFSTAQFPFANIGRQSDDPHSRGGCSLESGHVVADQSGRQRLNQLDSASRCLEAPRRRGVRSPHEKAWELLQVFRCLGNSRSLEKVSSRDQDPRRHCQRATDQCRVRERARVSADSDIEIV